MISRSGILAACVLAAVLVGCATPTYTVINDLPTPPTSLAQPTTQPASQPAPVTLTTVPPTTQPVHPTIARLVPAGWAPTAREQQWRYLIVHHSSTPAGSAASFDKFHRSKGWDEMSYHFVITNGQGGPDGGIEIGSRWAEQKWGAHTGGSRNNEYNNYGIGICVVGDFNTHMPTEKQLAALKQLTAFLMARYHLAPQNIIGHRDAPGAKTDCPGNVFHPYVIGAFRREMGAFTPPGL